MEERTGILVFESDAAILKDITCSLRLIGLIAEPIFSFAAVKQALEQDAVDLMLVRAVWVGDQAAKASLLEAVKAAKRTKVVLLVTASEREQLRALGEECFGVLQLPVEFPTFPNLVADMVQAVETGAKRFVVESEALAGEGMASCERLRPKDAARNLLVAYDIQISVLDVLRRDGAIERVEIEKVPQVVASVTDAVCREWPIGSWQE